MTDLLTAVDALTLPHRSKVIQDTADGDGTTLATVTLPPLLDRLEEAIRGTVGVGGAGALPNERNMLNASNLYLSVQITNLIKDWAHGVGIETRPGDQPGPLLRKWYVLFVQTKRYAEDHSFYLGKLRGWAKQIDGLFDPPRQMDLPSPCPVCDAKTWWQDGNEFPRPLVITFHDGPQMIEDGKGKCRACEAAFGLRELSYAIDENERKESA